MITISFQCATVAELHAEMYAFLRGGEKTTVAGGFGEGPTKTITEIMVRNEEAAKAADVKPFDINVANGSGGATPNIQPEKKTRKPRTKKAAAGDDVFETKPVHGHAAETEPATPPADQAAGPAIVNKEAVHQALQQVNISVGLPKAREILQSFKVNRISEIKEDQFKVFIEKCNEATMMA